MISGNEAFERLVEGNRRFVADEATVADRANAKRRAMLVDDQAPFAIVLGCSDSRAPAELVFDQGLGDLFVIRVAGNIVASSQIQSIEFAAEKFGTPLVVVMGHSGCGAVVATLEEIARGDDSPSSASPAAFTSIIGRIRTSVEAIPGARTAPQTKECVERAVRANVLASVERLRTGSEMLERLVHAGSLSIVGAEYSLDSGVVDFFYGVPEQWTR